MNPPTYPARPMNGGSLEKARQKIHPDAWIYEPKINGWRVLIDVNNKLMWSRYNQPSSVEHKYAAVLDRLASVFTSGAQIWLDGEILGQRASCVGRGSLVVFDIIASSASPPLTVWSWDDRRILLDRTIGAPRRKLGLALEAQGELWDINALPKQDTIYLLPRVGDEEAESFYEELKEANARLGVELYEGVVAKRVDKTYPIQLRSPAQETTDWIKHRWKY